jgi:AcrR family transcriptional regulator
VTTQADRKAETRRRLLDAAADLFGREGFHATSTDAVADAADRTSGSVYAHFGGKEGLLLALAEDMKDSVALGILREMVSARTIDDRVAALWHGFAGAADPWIMLEHELWLYAARNPDERTRLAARYDHERAALADEIEIWKQRDGDDPVAARELSILALGLLLGLEMQRRIDPSAVPDDLAVAGLEQLLGLFATTDSTDTPTEPAPAGKAP